VSTRTCNRAALRSTQRELSLSGANLRSPHVNRPSLNQAALRSLGIQTLHDLSKIRGAVQVAEGSPLFDIGRRFLYIFFLLARPTC
jgi:hypothetical protein